MGEIADMMLTGVLCEGCGCALEGAAMGYPRYCADCVKPGGLREGEHSDQPDAAQGEAVDWADHKLTQKVKKYERLYEFIQTAYERGWVGLSEFHFRKVVGTANRFDYWPSTCKVQWRGKVFQGIRPQDIEAFIDGRRDR